MQTRNVHSGDMCQRDVRQTRSAQVGQLMRSYRESFSQGGGRRRGLTQEALLERMGSVDSDYAERYSHATVSRWESGGTRPTLRRLKVFGQALSLSETEVAGLVLLAGLAPDFPTALGHVNGSDGAGGGGAAPDAAPDSGEADIAGPSATESTPSVLRCAFRFGLLRVLPLGSCLVGGYALSFYGWNNDWMPTAYVAFALGIVLAQGFLLPDRDAGLREFFWVSLFFLLTTPLLQFGPIYMDHYNFHTIGSLAGSQIPYVLALLVNLVIASAAGLAFQLLWRWQYFGDKVGSSALTRAASVALLPVLAVYAAVVIITNISVSVQLAVLLPVLAAVFTGLLVLCDPAVSPNERDRQFLLWTVTVVAIVSTTVGMVVIMAIYLSPDMPSVLPDHNLLRSWEIDFARLGFTREEALDRLNLGYVWHAIWVFAYMVFVVGGRLIISIYRIDGHRQ